MDIAHNTASPGNTRCDVAILAKAGSGELTMTIFLTTSEAASLLRIHPNTLRRLADAGLVEHVRIGRLYRFDRDALTRQNASGPAPRKEIATCPSVSEEDCGGLTSPHRAADELDNLLTQLTRRPRRNSTTD